MEVKIEWEVVSAICIGSTADVQGIGVDKATARHADGTLIIPVLMLKGRIRWECERIARALGWEVCDAPLPASDVPLFLAGSQRTARETISATFARCLALPGKRSALWFGDATLKEDVEMRKILAGKKSVAEHRPFDAQIRPGVSLSRCTADSAERTALFYRDQRPERPLPF